MKSFCFTVILLLTVTVCLSQPRTSPKKLKAKGVFVHSSTEVKFPQVLEKYDRLSVYSFDKRNENIGVTYEHKQGSDKTTFSVYIYPAGSGTEDRFRSEYLYSLQSIANVNNGVGATQYSIRYEGDGFKINGFVAELEKSNDLSRMHLYECGSWFLKYRITSNELDSIGINTLISKLENWFPPSSIASKGLLGLKAQINFARAAFVDSAMLYTTMGEAFKKIGWAIENVDSVERITGFPGLYLDLYTTAIKERVELWKKYDSSRKPSTDKTLAEYAKLVMSGYLEEFILDQFSMVMIIPEDVEVDMDGFSTWKQNNPLNIDLNRFYYIISYPE